MNSYETSATVEQQGQIHVSGVPFAVGTEVEITIREKIATEANGATVKEAEAGTRLSELFTRLQGRNTEPIGPLRREEIYDRKVLR
jgi:hypothetical protein